jgi:hypothetical protein
MSQPQIFPAPAESTAPSPRRRFVRFAIVLTVALFVFMLTLLYVDWVRYREPACEVIVSGTHEFDGAKITIDGDRLKQPLSAVFGELDRTDSAFFLYPGQYRLTIELKGHVAQREFEVKNGDIFRFNLGPETTTLPSTAPAGV